MTAIPSGDEYGRLFVADGKPLPTMHHCRLCRGRLIIAGPVVYCPRCDHLQDMVTPTRQEGTT